ncbi:MAG: serine protease [Acidobacteriota bacterium]
MPILCFVTRHSEVVKRSAGLSLMLAALAIGPAWAVLATELVPEAGPMQVGELVAERYDTAHPYIGPGTKEPALILTHEIHLTGATYIAPHFSRFELAEGDYVIVRSPDGRRSWRYEGYGKGELGRTEGFWGIHIPGDRLFVELYSQGTHQAYGYTIDHVARGFAPDVPVIPEAVCGIDDSDWAQCYSGTEPEIYSESRAVARLLINGTARCTGWLVGNEGHLFTNNHCISTPQAAANTDFEFMAEGMCGEFCARGACPGDIVTTMSTLVQTNGTFDYTLLLLDTNPTDTYGFFQLRETGPVEGERIYIPQHPRGEGKQIAVASTHPSDASGFGEIDRVFVNGTATLGTYYADTAGGSSGSPIVGYDDHCVVVLHQGTFGCTGLGNTGNVIDQIIADLGPNLPEAALCSPSEIFSDSFETGDTSRW